MKSLLQTLSRWIKQYSTVKTDDRKIFTAKQVNELQKRNAQLKGNLMTLKNLLQSSRHTPTIIRRHS